MLTARQQAFVDHYLICGNAAEAARLAGYAAGSAKVTGSRLLAHPEVQASLRERQHSMREEHRLSRAHVVRAMLEAIDMARCQYDPGTMIRGLSEIARMLGFFEPERRHLQLTHDEAALRHKLMAMSDEELLKISSNQSGRGV